MSLASMSVRRPVTTIMFFLLCFMLGVICWIQLPRELFPPLTFPQLNIVTVYPNAAPEEIENLITKIVEEAIGTVRDLKTVSSVSKEGASVVTAEFGWNTNMNFASLWVREKLDQVKERLPPECKEPVVLKYNPFSQPTVILNITGNASTNELLQICKKVIKDRLEKTEGVASVEISGGEEKEVLVEVDQGRLLANQLTLPQVVEAIKNSNLNYPAGSTNEKMYEYLIRTIGEYNNIQEIGQTVIDTSDSQSQKLKYRTTRERGEEDPSLKQRRTITLSSLADTHWAYKEKTSYSRYNSADNLSIAIRKRAESNTIFVSNQIQKTVENLQVTLKTHGVTIEIIYDQAQYIKDSISSLISDCWQGGLLAFIVIFFALNNLILSIIVTVSIPMSLLMTVILMYFSNISLNTMSLGGLALGAGMLVDTTIVVIENAFRIYTMNGSKDMKEATIIGSEQIGGAVISSTLTQIAVFLPLLFVIGLAGQIFRELSLTVIFTQICSILVSLSLVPRLISVLKSNPLEAKKTSRRWPLMEHINGFIFYFSHAVKNAALNFKPAGLTLNAQEPMVRQYYRYAVNHVIDNRKKFLTIIGIAFTISIVMLLMTEKTFLPKIDQGQFLINIDLPAGTRIDVTNDIASYVEKELKSIPQVKNVMTQVGSTSEQAMETMRSHQAQLVVTLFKKGETAAGAGKKSEIKNTADVIEDVKRVLKSGELKEAKLTYTMQDSVFKSVAAQSSAVIVAVKGQDMEKLKQIVNDITEQLKNVPGIVNISDDRPLSSPETKIEVDKQKASTYNLSVSDIARTALIGIKGMPASKFKEEGEEYDITVRLSEKDRKDMLSLDSLLVHASEGFNFPIKEVAKINVGMGPSQIKRTDQQRTITISADLYKMSLKKVTPDINRILEKYQKTFGYTAYLGGETEKIKESFMSLMFALIMAIILVYMIMASQFESIYQPFIILLTIPLSLIGVAVSLLVTHTSLNAISLLGIIILGGIVVNNGIVLIDYINQVRSEGVPLRTAVIDAAVTRLRPILMTTGSSIVGLIPLALGLGEGSELRSPMAITIIGGQITSTILTLGVIPSIYLAIEEWRAKKTSAKI